MPRCSLLCLSGVLGLAQGGILVGITAALLELQGLHLGLTLAISFLGGLLQALHFRAQLRTFFPSEKIWDPPTMEEGGVVRSPMARLWRRVESRACCLPCPRFLAFAWARLWGPLPEVMCCSEVVEARAHVHGLLKSQRLDMKATVTLLGRLSHELNTSLNAILGAAQVCTPSSSTLFPPLTPEQQQAWPMPSGK